MTHGQYVQQKMMESAMVTQWLSSPTPGDWFQTKAQLAGVFWKAWKTRCEIPDELGPEVDA